jgi:hypothetical protein
VVSLAIDAHIAEKHDYVAIHFSIVAYVAEKAHGIMDGGVGSDFNVVEELDRVLIGVGGRGGKRQGDGAEEAMGEESPLHRRNFLSHCEYTRKSRLKFPRTTTVLTS